MLPAGIFIAESMMNQYFPACHKSIHYIPIPTVCSLTHKNPAPTHAHRATSKLWAAGDLPGGDLGLSVHPEREEGDGGGGSRSTLLYLGGANQDDMFVSATLVWTVPLFHIGCVAIPIPVLPSDAPRSHFPQLCPSILTRPHPLPTPAPPLPSCCTHRWSRLTAGPA